MGEVSYVSLEHPIPTGYYPTMRFRNGLALPQRETGATVPLHMQKYVQVNTFLNINNNIMINQRENNYFIQILNYR